MHSLDRIEASGLGSVVEPFMKLLLHSVMGNVMTMVTRSRVERYLRLIGRTTRTTVGYVMFV